MTPAGGTITTIDVASGLSWFEFNNVYNTYTSYCPVTKVWYTTGIGSTTPNPNFVDSASATPISGTLYRAVPIDNIHKGDFTFVVRVEFEGGGILERTYRLILNCQTAQVLTFNPWIQNYGNTLNDPHYFYIDQNIVINWSRFVEQFPHDCLINTYTIKDSAGTSLYPDLAPPTFTSADRSYTIIIPTGLVRTF